MRLKGLERFGKGLLRAGFTTFLKTDRIERAALGDGTTPEERFHRVLIVKQDERLGNLVLMTPMLSALRDRLPRAEIHLLVSDLYASLFEADSRVDRLLVMEKRGQVGNPLVFLTFLKALRETEYDLVMEASDVTNFSFNNSFLARLARTGIRIGYAKEENKHLLNVTVDPPEEPLHATDMYLNLLRPLWKDLSSPQMSVDIPPEKTEWGRSLLASWRLHPGDYKLAIHVGGRGKKKLPSEGIVELSRQLTSAFGRKLIFVSGPMEEDHLARVRDALPPGPVFVSRLSITELASLLANIDLFISADTGPMHLAAACGCATLSIFTTSNPVKFAPLGDRHQYVRYLDGDLPVEEIMEKTRQLLPITQKKDEVR